MPKIWISMAALLLFGVGCRDRGKPVEIIEKGWVISCSDKSDATSSAHGLPFMLFQTRVGGHFDTFIFSSTGVPSCSTWRVRDVHELDMKEPSNRDYEITVVQHTNWRGDEDGTWDLVKMRSLADQ